MKFDGDLMM